MSLKQEADGFMLLRYLYSGGHVSHLKLGLVVPGTVLCAASQTQCSCGTS